MLATKIKKILPLLMIFVLTACNGFFEKDNTPTPNPLPPLQTNLVPRALWTVNTGSGSGKEYLKMGPTLTPNGIVTTSHLGVVTYVDKLTGRILWQTNTHLPLATSAGYGNGLIVAGSYRGDVVALQESTGQIVWLTHLPGEILAKPAIGEGIVVIKTIDGTVRGLSEIGGHEVWTYQQSEPNLILRGASSPLMRHGNIVVGFANGMLGKLTLSGRPIWTTPIAVAEGAFMIQRMIDIDADPIMYKQHLYAATYQGRIASIDWISGKILWSHDISSYTGMVADEDVIYITDARSHLWAFNANNGFVNWRQVQLEFRGITGPAVTDEFVVVGDAEGFLHWISKVDGHIVTRTSLSYSIYAAPVAENNIVYALNNHGYLVAYRL